MDPNLGWTYLRARWMDPETGRFASRDPFGGLQGDPQSLHRYTYAHLNPISNADPTGEFTLIEMLVVVSVLGLLAVFAAPSLASAAGKAKAAGLAELVRGAEQFIKLYGHLHSTIHDPIATVTTTTGNSKKLYTANDLLEHFRSKHKGQFRGTHGQLFSHGERGWYDNTQGSMDVIWIDDGNITRPQAAFDQPVGQQGIVHMSAFDTVLLAVLHELHHQSDVFDEHPGGTSDTPHERSARDLFKLIYTYRQQHPELQDQEDNLQ